MNTAPEEVQTFEVEIEEDDSVFTGRITGRLVFADERYEIYVTTDRRVLGYDLHTRSYEELGGSVEDLTNDLIDWFPSATVFAQVCEKLGIRPVVDL